MAKVTLLFSRQRSAGSAAIRLLTWGQWSHVDVIVTPEYAIGAVAFRGVVMRQIARIKMEASAWEEVAVEVPNWIDTRDALIDQLGKRYDWSGIFATRFGRRWNAIDKWFCSELAAWALMEGGLTVKHPHTHRITPQELYRSALKFKSQVT